ncbi:hypothetical protein HDU96_008251 [Phlyctochytrium bullatum]|nr:hypothetical protein HDU96_008251 [Phlyctochytrium bullatum]
MGDPYYWTPLHLACYKNDPTMVKFLGLEWNANTEARDFEDRTPLMVATNYGRIEVVRELLDLGADLFATDREGEDAIHYAFSMNPVLPVHKATAEALLEARARFLFCEHSRSRGSRELLLETAQRVGSAEECRLLRRAIENVRRRLNFSTPVPEEWP